MSRMSLQFPVITALLVAMGACSAPEDAGRTQVATTGGSGGSGGAGGTGGGDAGAGGTGATIRPMLPPLDLAVLGSAAKVRPGGAAEGPTGAVLAAGRNEFESFQIAVNAVDEPVEQLDFALAGPLAGPDGATIPASNVTLYRVAYYDVVEPSDLEGAPGRWPDPLVPAVDTLVGEARNAFPVDVPVGENRVAWIDLLVPEDATPGVYSGEVIVTAEGLESRVPIELTVLDFTLPSTTSLRSAFGINDHTCRPLGIEGCDDREVAAQARQLFLRAGLDNRVSLMRPHTIHPGTETGATEFRTFYLPFLDGSAQTRLPGAQLTTLQLNQVSDRNITPWRDEVERHGLLDRSFVWSCDEPYFFPVNGDPEGNWPICLGVMAQDRQAWPEVPKLVTAHIQTADDAGATRHIDIMVVNVEFLHGPEGTRWIEGNQRPLYDDFLASGPDKELWLYSACGSHGCTRNDDEYTRGWTGGYQIDAPASQTRATAWLAFHYAMQGTLYYDTVLQLEGAWEDQYRYSGNGEGTLFYPGTPDRIGGTTPIPIESMRLKFVRDGYEEYEYLAFLRANGRGEEAEAIARGLFPAPFDTTRSDAEVQAARLELLRLVASITGGPSPAAR